MASPTYFRLGRDDPSELAEGTVKRALEALGTERDRQGCRADDVHEERRDYAALDARFSHGIRQISHRARRRTLHAGA